MQIQFSLEEICILLYKESPCQKYTLCFSAQDWKWCTGPGIAQEKFMNVLQVLSRYVIY